MYTSLLQRLEISFCSHTRSAQITTIATRIGVRADPKIPICISILRRTSQHPTFLQMIDPFPVVALLQLVSHQPRHHILDPLFTDDCILCRLQSRCVLVVDTVEGWRHGRFAGEEVGRFGCRHCWIVENGEMKVPPREGIRRKCQ